MTTFVPPACPRCGQVDAVQRVAGLVASQNSPLTWQLRAPPPPGVPVRLQHQADDWPLWSCLLTLLLLTLPFDLIIVVVLAAVAAVLIVALTAFAVVAVAAYGLYRYLNRQVIADRKEAKRRDEAAALVRYQHAVAYWNLLHFCHRCYGVFLPENPWQYGPVSVPGTLVAPPEAWPLAQRLAAYADSVNAPDVLRLDR